VHPAALLACGRPQLAERLPEAKRAARILARQLGYAEVPVMVARGWSDAQKRAYVIADNQLALNAGWDERREAGVVTK
jgi:hypothetical protein